MKKRRDLKAGAAQMETNRSRIRIVSIPCSACKQPIRTCRACAWLRLVVATRDHDTDRRLIEHRARLRAAVGATR